MLARSIGLPPRRRSHLRERHVDEQQLAVQDHQVGRLDVAVGQAGVPQPAHHQQSLVDEVVVDLDVADLLGAVEELGDEQVLPLGRHLDDPVGGRGVDAGVPHQAEGVVLVLDQPPDGLERCLVLEASVEHGPTHLVPAVRPDVAHRVELPEEVLVGVARHPEPQRRRSAGAGEADRLEVEDRQPQLVAEGFTDGLAPRAGDVEVGRLALAVRDREDLVGGEEAERVDRDRRGQRDGHDHVEGVVHREVEPGEGVHRHQRDEHDLGPPAGRAGHDQGVDGPDEDDGHDGHRR